MDIALGNANIVLPDGMVRGSVKFHGRQYCHRR